MLLLLNLLIQSLFITLCFHDFLTTKFIIEATTGSTAFVIKQNSVDKIISLRKSKRERYDSHPMKSKDDGDWRTFRAKLVLQEKQQCQPKDQQNEQSYNEEQIMIIEENEISSLPFSSSTSSTTTTTATTRQRHTMASTKSIKPSNISSVSNMDEEKEQQEDFQDDDNDYDYDDDDDEEEWAYESGPDLIEQGSIILHQPPEPSTFTGKKEGQPAQNDDNEEEEEEEDDDAWSHYVPFGGYGLGKQYLHKSVVLILDHFNDEGKTTGIILNRPTDLIFDSNDDGSSVTRGTSSSSSSSDADDDYESNCETKTLWKIWFGGPTYSIHSNAPKFYCLHNIQSNNTIIKDLSKPIIKGIQFITFQDALSLVVRQLAKPTDFWTFCGIVEWDDSNELVEDLYDEMYHSVSTDARTIRNGLRILNVGSNGGIDPRHSGIMTWNMLMRMIGRQQKQQQKATRQQQEQQQYDASNNYESNNNNNNNSYKIDDEDHQQHETNDNNEESFDDLMLKEWATKYLYFDNDKPPFLSCLDDDTDNEQVLVAAAETEGRRTRKGEEEDGDSHDESSLSSLHVQLQVGDLMHSCDYRDKASISEYPFLLQDQEYHQCIMLLLSQDKNFDISLILNIPSNEYYEISVTNNESFLINKKQTIKLPVRYGGPDDYRTNVDSSSSITDKSKSDVESIMKEQEDKESNASDLESLSQFESQHAYYFLHNSELLKQYHVGRPIGSSNKHNTQNVSNNIWICNEADVKLALSRGIAVPNDIICIKGCTVFEKNAVRVPFNSFDSHSFTTRHSMEEQLRIGNFLRLLPSAKSIDGTSIQDRIWNLLQIQELVVSKRSLNDNIRKSSAAWHMAANNSDNGISSQGKEKQINSFLRRKTPFINSRSPLKNNSNRRHRQQQRKYVFQSNVKVSKLCNVAHKLWMKAFFL